MMAGGESKVVITMALKMDEWRLLVHEMKQSEHLAARYGNRKMLNTLHDIRKEIEHRTGYETDG